MKPDWLPDWRNESHYNADRSLDDWRWEFLRRNSDFLRDVESLPPEDQSEWKEANMAIQRKWLILAPIPHPRDDIRERNVGVAILLQKHFVDTDPFAFMEAPEDQEEAFRYLTAHIDTHRPLEPQLKRIKVAAKEAQDWLIKKKVVSKSEVTAAKSRKDLFPRYLRIWDAKLEKVTDLEIAKVVIPEETDDYDRARQAIRAGYKACKNLVEGGYKYVY